MHAVLAIIVLLALVGTVVPVAGLRRRHFSYIAAGSFVGLLGLQAIEPGPQMAAATSGDVGLEGKVSNAARGIRPSVENAGLSAAMRQKGWKTARWTDRLDGERVFQAELRSDNEVAFDFPYRGGRATMVLRRHPSLGDALTFRIDDGHFFCGKTHCPAKLEVDGVVERILLEAEVGGDPRRVRFFDDGDLVERLARSEYVRIVLPFHREGTRLFTFSMKAGSMNGSRDVV